MYAGFSVREAYDAYCDRFPDGFNAREMQFTIPALAKAGIIKTAEQAHQAGFKKAVTFKAAGFIDGASDSCFESYDADPALHRYRTIFHRVQSFGRGIFIRGDPTRRCVFARILRRD